MPKVVFTVKLDRILNGSKVSTTRKNLEYWSTLWRNPSRDLHMWNGNPRLKNRPRYVKRVGQIFKIGIAHWVRLTPLRGKNFTYEGAYKDGFDSVKEYVAVLGQENDLTTAEVLEHEWAVIEWDGWMFGPHNALGRAVTVDTGPIISELARKWIDAVNKINTDNYKPGDYANKYYPGVEPHDITSDEKEGDEDDSEDE